MCHFFSEDSRKQKIMDISILIIFDPFIVKLIQKHREGSSSFSCKILNHIIHCLYTVLSDLMVSLRIKALCSVINNKVQIK